MNKLISLILAVCALLGLCACGGASESSEPERLEVADVGEVTIAEPESTAEETTESAAELGSKTFTFDELTITLTDDFEEYETEDVDYALLADNIGVAVVKEEFTVLDEYGIEADAFSAYDYAVAAQESVGTDSNIFSADGYEYFIYDKNVTGMDFTYYSAVFKGSNAFWRVSFYTYSNLFDSLTPSFERWCASIVVA